MKDVLIIANPAAGGGRTGQVWTAEAARLRAAGLDFDFVLTKAPRHAVALAAAAVREGRPLIVAAGGDGTAHEVLNGFFAEGEPIACGSRLGILPLGTGGDLGRTLDLPSCPEEAATAFRAGRTRRLDVGRSTVAGFAGAPVVGHFLNVADAGLGGEVVHLVNRGLKVLNGATTYTLAAVLAGLRWRNRPMRVVVDGEAIQLLAQQVVVANCSCYGGGLRVAPRAQPDDGLLDLVLFGDLGVWEAARTLPRMRRGVHLDGGPAKISHRLARRVEISSPANVRVDVDGEQPGTLPALFEIQPAAIEVVVK